jgi:hypothetical protein
MKKSFPLQSAALAATLAVTLSLSFAASAQNIADNPDVSIATGEHWVNAQPNSKGSYLLGIANTLDIEQALQGNSTPADDASLVPVMMRGLNGMTLRQIGEKLDRWYADNPDQLQRPVIEIIWHEIAKPNS